ncbi:uncharacterized protein [Oscarella lobularis]|uniref:uncharacterized protein n=1 Tax=Oscarella lobularis TaxID=121494 RepID=UPI003313576A
MPLKLSMCHRIVLPFAVFTLGKGAHYRGGTFTAMCRAIYPTWPMERYKDMVYVHIRLKIAWRQTAEGTCPVNEADKPTTLFGSPVKWLCLIRNCGSRTVNDMRSYCTFANTRDDYYQNDTNENVFGIDPESNHRCCWITTTSSDLGEMRMFTTIDFTPHPDSGLLNWSPITDIVPLVPARTGCRHRLFIPHSDPDVQENVRCRWARPSNDMFQDECGIVCNRLEIAPYNVILDESSCEMIWTPPSPGQ